MAPTDVVLGDRVPQASARPPSDDFQLVLARRRGYVAEPVRDQLLPPTAVLVKDLEVDFRPPLQPLGGVVDVDGVGPRRDVLFPWVVHLGLALSQPLEKSPSSSAGGVNAPLAKQGLVRVKVGTSYDLANEMHFSHFRSIRKVYVVDATIRQSIFTL